MELQYNADTGKVVEGDLIFKPGTLEEFDEIIRILKSKLKFVEDSRKAAKQIFQEFNQLQKKAENSKTPREEVVDISHKTERLRTKFKNILRRAKGRSGVNP